MISYRHIIHFQKIPGYAGSGAGVELQTDQGLGVVTENLFGGTK